MRSRLTGVGVRLPGGTPQWAGDASKYLEEWSDPDNPGLGSPTKGVGHGSRGLADARQLPAGPFSLR